LSQLDFLLLDQYCWFGKESHFSSRCRLSWSFFGTTA